MSDLGQAEFERVRASRMRATVYQAAMLVCGLVLAIGVSRWVETKRPPVDPNQEDEQLFLTGKTLNRTSLGLSGVVADWYWMRSLQYVGRKIVNQPEDVPIDDLKKLNLVLLYPLLDTTTTLDPRFIAPYEYGGIVLPAIDPKLAIKLLEKGLRENPENWRLNQHLGYIYWKQGDYVTSARYYHEGGAKPGAPPWMEAMSARMVAEGGSRDLAREMYRQMKAQSNDDKVKLMADQRLMQIDSFDERDAIRPALAQFRERNGGRCPASWKEAGKELRAARVVGKYPLRMDDAGAPIDPSGVPYLLVQDTCEPDIDFKLSKVPYK
jgi:hypothetical protein